MALTSLRRLGASDEQLLAFQSRYSTRIEPVRFRDAPLKGDPWHVSRGNIHHHPGLCHWFEQELKTRGRQAVLNEWIPRLIDTAGVDAFHALIRTALAVESGVDEELSAGLAYWVGSWKSLPVEDGPRLSITAREAFDRLRGGIDLGAPLTGMFGDQLGQLFESREFRQLIRWRGPNMGIAELAREAAQIYLACGHFFALHMVTGTQAVH